MDVKTIANQLKILCQKPENRIYICQDETSMGALTKFCQHQDPEVVGIALQTLHMLAMILENRALIAKRADLIDAIKKQMIFGVTPTCTTTASNIYTLMQGHLPEDDEDEEDLCSLNSSLSSHTSHSSALRQQNGVSFKNHVFMVKELDSQEKKYIETQLLKIPGIMSFVLDVPTKKMTIRSSHRRDVLLKTLRSTVTLRHFTITPEGKMYTDKENEPDYLDDEYDDEEEEREPHNQTGWWSSIVTFGTKTVDQRKEEKRREEEKKKQQQQGFMNSLWSIWG